MIFIQIDQFCRTK